ncbi:acyl-CoA dehydrogenase family protein [Chloroflexota bacterium]
MDFSLEYTKEQEEFAEEVREWMKANVPKDIVNVRDPVKTTDEERRKRREIGRRLGKKGWLLPGFPRKYGGGDLDLEHRYVLSQEFEKAGLAHPPYYDSGLALAAAAILVCGTEEQKEFHLTPLCKGEIVSWQLFTEPEAGTDEASQQSNALRHEREGEYFIVNGGKIFVGGLTTHPDPPDRFLLLTRSDLEAPRHGNLAMFLAPANLPGITILPLDLFASGTFAQVSGVTVDVSPAIKHQVFFDDVRIHESYLIGGDHDGWKVATATLEVEHGGGEANIPSPNFVVERFLSYCKSNPNVAKRLDENPQLLNSVADIYIGAEIERLLGLRNAWLASSGIPAGYAGPQLNAYSKMYGTRLTADMANVLGPYAFTDDAEWGVEEDTYEVIQRSGLCVPPGGTPEAQKIIMSRALRIGR